MSLIIWALRHFLPVELLLNPITYRCLLRVLSLVRRPLVALDFVLLQDNKWAFAAGLGPWNQFLGLSLSTTRTMPHCQMLVFLPTFNMIVNLLLVISFPHTPACPETQYSPTVCQVEKSLNAFWHYCNNADIVLAAWNAFRAAWPTEQILPYFFGITWV
jgi:hypothetical protein